MPGSTVADASSARDSPASLEARSRGGSVHSQQNVVKPPGTPLRSHASGAGTPTQARSRQGSFSSASPLQKQASVASLARSAAASAAAAADVMSPTVASGAGSRRNSVRSQNSQGTLQHSTTLRPPSVGDQASERAESVVGTAVGSPSLAAQDVAAPSPAPPTPQEAPIELTTEERLEKAERELADSRAKVYSLEQTNASLQRLMASGSADSKVKLLTADLNKRVEKIKALEAEVKKQTKRADDAETKAKQASLKDKRQSRSSMNLSQHGSNQDKAVIKDLQAKLAVAEMRGASAEPAQPHSHDGGQAPQVVSKLQTMLAEKETEKLMLSRKLEQAQDAIVSSAGAGFENEVKLQQARSALQSILRSQSPQHTAANSPALVPSMRAMSPASMINPASTNSFRQHQSITSTASRPRGAYYDYTAV